MATEGGRDLVEKQNQNLVGNAGAKRDECKQRERARLQGNWFND